MKASELRIGNFYDHNGFVNEVHPNTIEEVWISERSWVKPIPLSEEWLIKFGFKKRDMLSSVLFDMKNPRFSIYLNPPIDKSNKWNILGIEKNVNIQYVHQLQNLYFALTGKELTLKL